jgi:glycosyltransferase involved in cell wall biosynthesis
MTFEVLPVSVVIPAYRRPEMTERALRSVLAQHPRPEEILVVDDCSGDDTGKRAAALGARVIAHERNLGEGEARNTGLRAASHDWVALLDSDDEWLPGHLNAVWQARDGHVMVGTAALGCGSRSEDHRIYGWSGRRRVLRTPPDVLLPENKFVPSSVLLRRDAALAVGGFQANMPRAADLDMWVRLLEIGTALALPCVSALYHIHSGQVSLDQSQMWHAHRWVIDRYTDRPWWTTTLLLRHEGIVAWDTARARLAAGASLMNVARFLLPRLASPQRVVGVVQLLVGRAQGRRLATRYEHRSIPRGYSA